jgi:hypothetical protein
MCAQIVEIGDFRLKRERQPVRTGCQHKHLTLDDDGEFVTCDDCHTQVGNYAALRMLVERWALLQGQVDARQRTATEAMQKTVGLRAAQRLEKAWRSRSMVPTCPHCNEGIFPTDGFGGSMVNKAIATKRRAVGKQDATHAPVL